MTFDEPLNKLLTDTFWLAAGKTRSAALESERYKQLQSEVAHVPYVSTDDVAEMMLLGEQIADRAFQTLPIELQRLAKVWQYVGHNGQVDILRTLMRVLGVESQGQHSADFNINGSLPDQYGNWMQSNLLPNCLGMVQMLVGFARATGAPHMIIKSLRPYEVYSSEYCYLRFRELLSIIEPYTKDRSISKTARIISKASNDMLQYLEKYSQTVQSHVLLSIRTDNEWWIVDPYMEVCCIDDYNQKTIDRFYKTTIKKRPSGTVTVESNRAVKEVIVGVHLMILREHIPYLDKFNQPRSEWSFDHQGKHLVYDSLAGLYRHGKEARDQFEICAVDTMQRVVYPKQVYKKIVNDRPSPLIVDDAFITDLRARVDALDRTKRIRNQAYRRAVYAVIRNAYDFIFDIDVGGDTPSTVREYLHPTMQLAVKTINQLAIDRKIDVPQLIKFGSSQWLVYNMLGSVERSSDKRLKQILAKTIRRIQKDEWAALPQLRPYLSQPTGEHHGKA